MLSNLKAPVYVQVELTSRCNHHCVFCYNFWREQAGEHREDLSVHELERVAQVLSEQGIFYVTITGGEPLLYREGLFAFIEALLENNIRVMINSNATLVDEEIADRLGEYPIEVFLVSVLGHNAEIMDRLSGCSGVYGRFVRGIDLLLDRGLPLAANMVASSLSYKEVYATGHWMLERFGIRSFSATPMCSARAEHAWLELDKDKIVEVIRALSRLQQDRGIHVDILEAMPTCIFSGVDEENLTELLSARICTAGSTTVTVGSEGDVRVCSYDNIVYGNILHDPFQSIWKDMSAWRDGSLVPEICRSCEVVGLCGGGCRVNSRVKTGSYCELSSLAKGELIRHQNIPLVNLPVVELSNVYTVAENIVYREEADDRFLIVANPMQFVILNTDGLELIDHLVQRQKFVPEELIREGFISLEQARMFFSELIQKGFIFVYP